MQPATRGPSTCVHLVFLSKTVIRYIYKVKLASRVGADWLLALLTASNEMFIIIDLVLVPGWAQTSCGTKITAHNPCRRENEVREVRRDYFYD